MRPASSEAWTTWELEGTRRTPLGERPAGMEARRLRLLSSAPLGLPITSSSFSVDASQFPLSRLWNLCAETKTDAVRGGVICECRSCAAHVTLMGQEQQLYIAMAGLHQI